jgi:hypothetical protein
VWNGDHNSVGVYRNVACTPDAELKGLCKMKCEATDPPTCSTHYEEFISAVIPEFDNMRCFTSDDLNKLIAEAMRSCK